MSKRILIVGHSGDMYGASRSLVKLTGILSQHHTVYILIPESGALHQKLKDIVPADRILIDKDLYIFTRKSFKLKYLGSTSLRFLKNLRNLGRIIRKYNIDLVHTNSGVIPVAALAAKLNGRKHIWHIREWFGDFKKFWPFYSAYMNLFSDRIVCVSKTMAAQFPGKDKIHSIYNGFDIPSPNGELSVAENLLNKLNDADLILGCTSRIRLVRKGQEYLIEAVGMVSQRTKKKIHIILIGDYVPGYESHEQVIKELISKFHLEDCIHFLGHLENPLPYYKLFDVFVLPSGEPEPFGGVIMEAMSMGLPVIGSNAGGTTEQIRDSWNGYLFKNKDSADLAQKIELFLNDRQKIELFGARSKERIEQHFSLDLHKENILKLYDSVIGALPAEH